MKIRDVRNDSLIIIIITPFDGHCFMFVYVYLLSNIKKAKIL